LEKEPKTTPTKATELSSKTKKIRKCAKIIAMAGAGVSAAALILTLIPILLVGIVMTVVSTILLVVTKPKGQKATKTTELPPRIQRMRRYAKSGLLIAVASSILQFFGNSFRLGSENAPYAFPVLYENQPFLSVGILVGILIAFASTIARILMETASTELHTRKILGVLLGYLSCARKDQG
jgi:hypothetical protein